MSAEDRAPNAPIRYGSYLCIPERHLSGLAGDVAALVERLGLVNEATWRGDPAGPALGGAPSRPSVSFLRRVAARPGAIEDVGLRLTPAPLSNVEFSGTPGPGWTEDDLHDRS